MSAERRSLRADLYAYHGKEKGRAILVGMAEVCGGEEVWIPSLVTIGKEDRDERIIELSRTLPLGSIYERFGYLSERHIRRIVNRNSGKMS